MQYSGKANPPLYNSSSFRSSPNSQMFHKHQSQQTHPLIVLFNIFNSPSIPTYIHTYIHTYTTQTLPSPHFSCFQWPCLFTLSCRRGGVHRASLDHRSRHITRMMSVSRCSEEYSNPSSSGLVLVDTESIHVNLHKSARRFEAALIASSFEQVQRREKNEDKKRTEFDYGLFEGRRGAKKRFGAQYSAFYCSSVLFLSEFDVVLEFRRSPTNFWHDDRIPRTRNMIW